MTFEPGNLIGADPTVAHRLWSLPAALAHLEGFVSEKAGELGKSADLAISCPSLLVTPRLVESLTPAVVQLMRNAVEHGVELPVDRLMAGKALTATIALSVTVDRDRLIVIVRDDGRGVEPDEIVSAAAACGETADANNEAPDALALLPHRGISLAEEGGPHRGNGLKRAGQRLRSVRGAISFASERGASFTATITIPLSSAGKLVIPGGSPVRQTALEAVAARRRA